MSTQVLVPLDDGKLALGRWQGIFFCEFDGPRDRKVYVTTLAVTQAQRSAQQSRRSVRRVRRAGLRSWRCCGRRRRSAPSLPAGARRRAAQPHAGIHKIRHVVVIMQENRSFDSYFGTYPGRRRDPDEERRADGLRARPADARLRQRPYHDTADRNAGGPHDHVDARRATSDGGKMNGFIARRARGRAARVCRARSTRRRARSRRTRPT